MEKVYKLKPSFGTSAPPSLTIKYDQELNAEQLPVVKSENGPALIIAGAGSGKTRTITYRVAYLVESGIPLSNILLVTFTNKAAKEMIFRVEGLLRRDLKGLCAGTFHHIGNLILRKHAKKIGFEQNFTILDRADSKYLLDKSLKASEVDTKSRRFPKADVLQDVLSYAVNTLLPLNEVIEKKYPHLFELQAEIKLVFQIYDQKKREQNLMDFDDLQSKWLELLQNNPDVLREYSERFFHILVDEYQDTNTIQAQIIDLLASYHKNLTVVGDDSQSIYSFRGAEFRNIIDFPVRYPNCKVYKLETNHRSTPEILDLANDSIKNAVERFEKNLKAIRKKGKPPALLSFRDVFEQANFVAQRILELNDEGMSFTDMAVIYRSHYHCLELQMELTRRGIPHEVRSGMRLFEEAHIKDVIAYMKIFHNAQDGISWLRILKLIPGVGQKTAEKIIETMRRLMKNVETGDSIVAVSKNIGNREVYSQVPGSAKDAFSKFQSLLKVLANMTNTPSVMFSTIVDSGYADYLRMTYPNAGMRLDEIEELANYASSYKNLEEFLSALALVGGVAAEEISETKTTSEKEAVVLTTVHQAKGLEWKAVFVIWLADGRFPSYLTFGNPKELEEERRAFYVAITRSKDQLYLSYPIIYRSYEGEIVMKASRFIKEISENRYEKWLIEGDDDGDFFTPSLSLPYQGGDVPKGQRGSMPTMSTFEGSKPGNLYEDDFLEFDNTPSAPSKPVNREKFFWEK
ncbi:ATP-dependent helicase [Candidatus Saganbacteria bacterium]|nr:ATP-dependent helicase [Candidatus Saganbacteria bacterium]